MRNKAYLWYLSLVIYSIFQGSTKEMQTEWETISCNFQEFRFLLHLKWRYRWYVSILFIY